MKSSTPSPSPDKLAAHRPNRKEMANTVINDPQSYKVCLVCHAIVDRDVVSCPDCYAYRFISDPQSVADQAIDLGAKEQTAVSHLDDYSD